MRKGFKKKLNPEYNEFVDINTKIIIIENEKVAKILEEKPFAITWCSICNKILKPNLQKGEHISSKFHKKTKKTYGLTSKDDINCIIQFNSVPGDITDELKTQRLKIIRKRVKKMRVRLAQKALKHECEDLYGKDY